MTERVALYSGAVGTADTLGGTTTAYTLVASADAEVTTLGSRELLRSAQPAGTITHRVKIRDHGTRPTVRWRLIWRGRTLYVVSVAEYVGGYELSCVEADS